MITLRAGAQIWIAAGVTDLRRDFTGLSALVQMKLEQDPFGGRVFVFRGWRGDLIKILWWDGDGLCLFAKRIERGRLLPDLNTLDLEALRALALEQRAQLVSRDIEIDNLKLLVLKLKRTQFGRKSEKLDRQIGQLELPLEELECVPAAQPAASVSAVAETVPNKPRAKT